MSQNTTIVKQSIEYLLGLDTAERWRDDLHFSPSPEDYGNCCALTLSELENQSSESIAALIYGAMKHHDERVRCSCAEAIATFDSKLAKIIFFLQTLDIDDHVRDSAFESLWHIDKDNLSLARKTCDRLLNDEDDSVRYTAKVYKKSDNGPYYVHEGPKGGKYIIEKNGKKQYL